VTSSAVCRLLLVGLLASSLSLKLMDGAASETSYRDLVGGWFAAFLDRHGFVDQETVELAGLAGASGWSGDCRLVLVDVAPQGWYRNLLSRVASPSDQLLFIFRGRPYANQPVWWTRLYGYWSRVAVAIGWQTLPEPVYGVVASRRCDLTRMRWHEVTGD
jgi:hypothetical protein